jgi:hypothetical protein
MSRDMLPLASGGGFRRVTSSWDEERRAAAAAVNGRVLHAEVDPSTIFSADFFSRSLRLSDDTRGNDSVNNNTTNAAAAAAASRAHGGREFTRGDSAKYVVPYSFGTAAGQGADTSPHPDQNQLHQGGAGTFSQPSRSLQDFGVVSALGAGRVSKVYRVRHLRSGEEMALKCYIRSHLDDYTLRTIRDEIALHSALAHPSIATFLGGAACPFLYSSSLFVHL